MGVDIGPIVLLWPLVLALMPIIIPIMILEGLIKETMSQRAKKLQEQTTGALFSKVVTSCVAHKRGKEVEQ
jgi:hypothetical protein